MNSCELIFLFLGYLSNRVISSATLGSPCSYSFQCLKGAFCYENICRKAACRINHDCPIDEVCTHGKVDDHYTDACFPLNLNHFSKLELCPGGGKPVVHFGGKSETCDLQKQCAGKGICNPFFGVCCSKLRICPYPKKPLLESFTNRPVICQFRGKLVTNCARGTCEQQSGFCCVSEDDQDTNPVIAPTPVHPPNHIPFVGEKCTRRMGCSGNAACVCDKHDRNCICECLKEMGYTLDAETKTCKRSRRRLKEKCKSDMECQAAFSECTSGGCRCKSGFQRDGNGGCMPTSYRCVNHAEPLKFEGRLVTCTTLKSEQTLRLLMDSAVKNSTILQAEKHKKFKNCPSSYYCVAVFDLPKKPNLYQGFCCPLPAPDAPVCPVGNPFSGSAPPDYGCKDCPMDHFCHYDGIATKKEICCPKPCLSPDDVYVEGQCYAIGYLGDSCVKAEQCIGRGRTSSITSSGVDLADMECVKGICECPKGFLAVEGSCTRIECTIGNRGEPITDSLGHIIKCRKSSDCSQGSQCDPQYKVCCKTMGANRCPKGFIETGEKCAENICSEISDRCIVPKNSKHKICCREEN